MADEADEDEGTIGAMWVRETDILEGACLCPDKTCACAMVRSEPVTNDQVQRFWWWIAGPLRRGQA